MNTITFSFLIVSYFCFINAIQSRRLTYDEFQDCARISLPSSNILTIDVLDFGAKGDGVTDDSQAFARAWSQACSSSQDVTFVIPQRTFLLKPITFSGPCSSEFTVELLGDIIASENTPDYANDPTTWLLFNGVANLAVQGGGMIDGRGSIWWRNSCKVNPSEPCRNAPTALTFQNCRNLAVNNINIQNSQQIHLMFHGCTNVVASGLTVTAPESSPNTDGIHVSGSQNVTISSTTIGTGDDCISIVTGSTSIRATGITCGPGHGISIGSLGERGTTALVQDVVVDGAVFTGTSNGVRIKTWEGGSGRASNITFRNIQVHNVMNPIIINQNYCDSAVQACSHAQGAVLIENVLYKNISGTSATQDAITFNCTETSSCQGITLQNINLVAQGGGRSYASCVDVHPQILGAVSPTCPTTSSCLSAI